MAGVPSAELNSASSPAAAAEGEPAVADPADGLRLYAAGIDSSDYVARVAPTIRALAGDIGDLLDIGAGGGQLGAALRTPGRRWTAVEPSPVMHDRLRAVAPPPELIVFGWPQIAKASLAADTVLAANMPAPLTDARNFLRACRRFARKHIVWVVPAQNGPRGLCLAGCLPADWHGEDETPGVDIILAQLEADERPQQRRDVPWTFTAELPDLAWLATYLADRLGWPPADPRRPLMRDRLTEQAEPAGASHRLHVPKVSSVLFWGV